MRQRPQPSSYGHGPTQVLRVPERERVFKEAVRRFGGRVRELRLARGISQDALAERAGLHGKKVSVLEHGGSNTTMKTMAGLAFALGVDISELFVWPAKAPQRGDRAPQKPRRKR